MDLINSFLLDYKIIKINLIYILQQIQIDKWFAKGPTIVQFDSFFQHYVKVIGEVDNMVLTRDQVCYIIKLH